MADGLGEFDRITRRADMMGGRPCVRGMRFTVGMIVGQIESGRSIDDVLGEFPELQREDVLQALQYAAYLAQDRVPDLLDA